MKRLLALYLFVTSAASLAAQTVFRTGVEVVQVDVSVMRGGRPVQGLTSRDFGLTDNGIAQDVDTVSLDRLPLSVALVLDVSQSLSGARLSSLVQAGRELTRTFRADDKAALITFSQQIDLRVALTNDMERVRMSLELLSGRGPTALRDAVYLAIQLRHPDRARPLILLFTDGHDTASWLTEDDVLESLRRTATVIHVVRVESDSFLDRVAVASGGRTWLANSERQLQELFTRAVEEMRTRYLITYSPRGVNNPGWHEIKVELREKRGDITARPGYFVADPSR